MKKENKELAKQRRAAAREKEAKRASLIRGLKIWIPVALAAAAVILIIVAIATSGNSGNTDDGSADNGAEEGTDPANTELDLDFDDTYGENENESTLNTTKGVAVENGDVVNIDYTGYIDGEAFSGGSTDGLGTDLEIGSGSYIEGFEEGIIGHTIGDTFDLNLSFPDDYWNEEFAGKDVVFTTTINGIYE